MSDAFQENFTDLGNMRRLVKRFHTQAQYCQPEKSWYLYDSVRWCRDDGGNVMALPKVVVEDMHYAAKQITDEGLKSALKKWALKSEQGSRLREMLSLAQSEPRISILPEQFDADPWLLNTDAGTIDLHTGTLRDHDSDNYITKCTAPVGKRYGPQATCPTWLAFLNRTTNGDAELIAYLQRAVGYSLIGVTTERVLFLPYGPTGTGKSTFLETIRTVLGNYAASTPPSTLMAKRGDHIPNDVAALKGVRFVTAVETEDGEKIASAKVKRMTGNDVLSARFLYKEFFDFKPEFTLWLGTNHLPQIPANDDAIWARLRPIPFTVQIPSEERDIRFRDKLLDEAPGILAWAVKGAVEWHRTGTLGTAAAIDAALDEYRLRFDPFGRFLEDCTVKDAKAFEPVDTLHAAYVAWRIDNDAPALTENAFSRELTLRGYVRARTKHARGRTGLRLRGPVDLSGALERARAA